MLPDCIFLLCPIIKKCRDWC